MLDEERCFRTDAEMSALERIAADDHARRELLWLRAMEKADSDTALDLERLDPGLRDRLRDVCSDFNALGPLTPRERRDWFAAQWHACYDRHAGDLSQACSCSRCIAVREE